MTRVWSLTALVLVGMILAAPAARGGDESVEIDIPYTKHVLDNGLTLIVSEDHKAPIVAVNVWYHVGSKNEKAGKTGFAHLFEHLMFNGSENYNDDYFKPFDRVGATGMNGTTNFDRTNYFQNVPKTALDLALWMESDRMGHLLGAIDQDKLDEQRGVVQNEKRQGENQPYGHAFRLIFENTYPKGHPYSWSVIGSMEDLDAASVEDVHEWFKTYYGAANAAIAVVGDVNTQDVIEKVEAYFGDIPAGPPVHRQASWVAKRTTQHRMTIQDRVPQARVYKVWNIPEWGTPDTEYLELVADVLAQGKTSRLYRRLVHQDQIATDVTGFSWDRELGGLFIVWATAQPGQDLAEVERVLEEELDRLIADGPTRKELERVQTSQLAGFVRGIERIGGFGGKSDILLQNQIYGDNPEHWRASIDRKQAATTDDVQGAAERWLSNGDFVLEVHPFPEYTTLASNVDRTAIPEITEFPEGIFPTMERATLSNGMDVILSRRSSVPVVNFNLMLDAGYAADQFSSPGTASLTMAMLDEGTKQRSSVEISEELEALGANLGAGSNLDVSSVSLSALRENLGESLDIYADVILNPSFPQEEFTRLQKQQIAQIDREKVTPMQMGLRVMPKLMYGADHAYGLGFTGSGDTESVSGLTREKLAAWHGTWFRPNNATLVVVGDIDMATLTPKLEELFSGWEQGDVPQKDIAAVQPRSNSVVYIMDRPESIQSIIFAGHVAPAKTAPNDIAIEAMNDVLGSSFNARINMNLREDKHWSYGARSLLVDSQGQRPFLVFAPVQSDKTMESMQEVHNELAGIVTDQPATDDEMTRVKDKNVLSLPGRWETANAVSGDIADMVRYGLAEDYWTQYASRVRSLTLDDINAAAHEVVHPEQVIWLVVGDRATIEPGIAELGFGEIIHLDADGNPVNGNGMTTEDD